MALPSAPASISLNQVNVELGLSGTATISLNDAAVRTLFGVPSGQISMSDGYGKSNFWKAALTKGFFIGGYSTTTNRADRTTYSTETTAAVPGANFTVPSGNTKGAGNTEKGFSNGGVQSGANSNQSQKTTFSTETTALAPGANLSSIRTRISAAGNKDKGFYTGGLAPGPIVTTADRTTYSSDTTAAVTGANLSQARGLHGGVGNPDKAFFSGGATNLPAPAVATADRTTFSTETTAAVTGANLSLARLGLNASGSQTKGYFHGGQQIPAGVYSTVDGTPFSTETNAVIPGAAFGPKNEEGANGNDTKGFFAGGSNSLTTFRLTYSSETSAAVPGANLSVARNNISGF